MNGIGSGNCLTLNTVWLTVCVRPSIVAVTEIATSVPTDLGFAIQLSPERVSVPFVMVAEMALFGIPGTDMLMGLSIPAYSTFIIVADTVADGSITVYDEEKGWRSNDPSPADTSKYPL